MPQTSDEHEREDAFAGGQFAHLDRVRRAANSAAFGVCRTSGGLSFIAIHGATSIEHSPGTMPATNQLDQVIGVAHVAGHACGERIAGLPGEEHRRA